VDVAEGRMGHGGDTWSEQAQEGGGVGRLWWWDWGIPVYVDS
jgi:hypothetical protein